MFYVLGASSLHAVALNSTSVAIVPVGTAAAPDVVMDMTWQDGQLWVATRDRGLHQVDPDTGAWATTGRLTQRLEGLY